MDLDPAIPKYQNSDPLSFASPSVKERWPAIVTGVIDDVHRAVSHLPSDATDQSAEGKKIISDLAALKYEMQHNRRLVPLNDDGQPDIKLYNDELEQRGSLGWHESEWLFSECYLYRRMSTCFSTSKLWRAYDPFHRQKISTFRSSRPAVIELASRYREIISKLQTTSKVVNVEGAEQEREAEKVMFMEMAEICLWGNATDLSLLTALTYEDIQKLQGVAARKESEKNVLVNDLSQAFDVLYSARSAKKRDRRVDIVLDNAGFELFVDLVLAGYLVATGLATQIVLHPKSVPWFVSDVVPADFQDLLTAMSDPRAFYERDDESDKKTVPLSNEESETILFMLRHWSELHGEGQLILRPNRFWTHAGSFWRMPKRAPELFQDLAQSELVIFKGDLNYRKLVGDGVWDPTTRFADAIGPLGHKSGLRVLALRTCKGDVVVGLAPGKDEELRAMPGNGGDSGRREWAWNGKWAVIEFSDGKD